MNSSILLFIIGISLFIVGFVFTNGKIFDKYQNLERIRSGVSPSTPYVNIGAKILGVIMICGGVLIIISAYLFK